MVPNFVMRMRDRGLPAEPPRENPYENAHEKWDELREYAAKVLQMAEETNDTNRTLVAQNEALQTEVERLTLLVNQLSRENRVISAFGEHLRTRLTVIREGIETAERESLEYAHQTVTTRDEPTPKEAAEVRNVVGNIARINGLPQNKW